MNALKSGIDAQSNIIRGENAAGCQPSTALEQLYVDILIRNDWQLRRMERVDAEFWEYRLEGYSKANYPEIGMGPRCPAANSAAPGMASAARTISNVPPSWPARNC
jgi:hypothetical protein